MAVLSYRDREGKHGAVRFSRGLLIGSEPVPSDDQWFLNQLLLPEEQGVASQHAVIVRTVSNGSPTLVDMAGRGIQVNGARVISLKVLQHGDEIRMGDVSLRFREIEISCWLESRAGHSRDCPVCAAPIEAGEEVITCPKCPTIYHRNCWFAIEVCGTYACGYGISEAVMNALTDQIRFTRNLSAESDLVRRQERCAVRGRRDLIPFQMRQNIAHCSGADCQAAFHLACWATLDGCPKCGVPVKSLIDRVFAADPDQAPDIPVEGTS